MLTKAVKTLNAIRTEASEYEDEPIYKCDDRLPDDPEAWGSFLPVYNGAVGPRTPSLKFTGQCFDFDIEFAKRDTNSFDLNVTASNKRSLLCKDVLFIANTEVDHILPIFRAGTHVLTIELKDTDMKEDVAFNGMQIFQFCNGLKDDFFSILHTAETFIGGLSDHPLLPFIGSHTPAYMEKANLDFIKEGMLLDIEEREIHEVNIPGDYISSGDFFLIMRLDGLDPMIMYGTGSHGAHCVMALRFDGELYIVESQDAWYWPTAGLQRTPYAKWVKQAREASFNVIWMPMSGKSMLKFNEKAANDWFFQTEGLPYGYHNFLFGWIDTPRDNLPPVLAD
jgi:hypothetical protein